MQPADLERNIPTTLNGSNKDRGFFNSPNVPEFLWRMDAKSLGSEEPQKPAGIVLVDSDQLTSAARLLRLRDKRNPTAFLAAADKEMRAYLDKVAPMPDLTAVLQRCLAKLPPPLPPETKIGDAFGPLLDGLDKAAAK
ncbi:MAG: hypothetical protein ACR2IE_10540 [Candidatus Sumerlaeaceae bacterium]